jgi:hypothetical protein
MDISRALMSTTLFIILSLQVNGQASDTGFVYREMVYKDNIASVQFYRGNDFSALPVIPLSGGARLTLEFDDMDGDFKFYTYTVIHCDRNWTASDELFEADYLANFTREEIFNYTGSIGTYELYTHYELTIPNNRFNWTLSGNYALLIHDQDNGGELVMIRRFVVIEEALPIQSRIVRPSQVQLMRSHHEIRFSVNTKNFFLNDPMRNLTATIVQNRNWNTALDGIEPRRIMGEEVIFDYANKIVFPAFKPFRLADLRSTRFRAPGIYAIEVEDRVIWVTMETDINRVSVTTLDDLDMDGAYVIDNAELPDPDIRSEYMNVLFTLESASPIYQNDVYILGAFNDFNPSPEYKLEYIPEEKIYAGEVWLKQGVYDYYYGHVAQGSDFADWDKTEGDWFQTNNTYHILIYYRPFGGRYDRVIAYAPTSY